MECPVHEWQIQQYAAALRRMKRAHERGTGCNLTADMIEAMSNTLMGEWWGAVGEDGRTEL